MLESTVSFSQEMKALAGELGGTGEVLKREITVLMDASVKSIKAHTDEISDSISTLAENSLRAMQEKNNDSIQNLEETTRKVLSNFGKHMASVSEKLGGDFVRIQTLLSQRENVR